MALLSTNQRNAPNQTLINADAEMQLELLPPFFSYNPEGDLTGETEKITLELKQRVQPFLEPVEWPVEEEEEEEEGAGLGPPPAPPGPSSARSSEDAAPRFHADARQPLDTPRPPLP